jgi:hypothetical protein
LTVEVAFTVTRLYLARMLQRTLPAGFIRALPPNYPLTDRLQFDIL